MSDPKLLSVPNSPDASKVRAVPHEPRFLTVPILRSSSTDFGQTGSVVYPSKRAQRFWLSLIALLLVIAIGVLAFQSFQERYASYVQKVESDSVKARKWDALQACRENRPIVTMQYIETEVDGKPVMVCRRVLM